MYRLVTYTPVKPLTFTTTSKPLSMFLPPPRRVHYPESGLWLWQAAGAMTIRAGRGARRRARKMSLAHGATVAVVSRRGREVYRHAPVYFKNGMAVVVV